MAIRMKADAKRAYDCEKKEKTATGEFKKTVKRAANAERSGTDQEAFLAVRQTQVSYFDASSQPADQTNPYAENTGQ